MAEVGRGWVRTTCVVCGDAATEPLFAVPHPDAPGGAAAIVRCSTCGLRRLDPRPSQETVAGYYAADRGFNAYAGRRRRPAKQALWNFLRDGFASPAGHGALGRVVAPLTRPIAAWLFDVNVPLGGRRGLRVLEVGSGFGDLLVYLRDRGCSVLGVDLSPAAAARGREYGVEIRVGELRALGLPAAAFDVVVMNHSLEHFPDPREALAEARRVLVPGGRLHLAVPNGDAVRLRLDRTGWAHLSAPLHYWFFDATSLCALLRDQGFTVATGPTTTTRHHALRTWRTTRRQAGLRAASAALGRFLAASVRERRGGDVLRLVATAG